MDADNFKADSGVELQYFSWREIKRESLMMGDILGHGEFGMVVKATWINEENNTRIPVAVKTIKGIYSTQQWRKNICWEWLVVHFGSLHLTSAHLSSSVQFSSAQLSSAQLSSVYFT